jgi:predicted nucleic acid-binding protein
MRFWDSSGLVPLLVEEEHSKACRELLRADPRILAWTLTRTELVSALWRVHRDGLLDRRDVSVAERRLDAVSRKWAEVDAVLPVREQAERLLRVHALRAADALQLAAALIAVDHRPRGRAFVCLDERLCLAADAEGFAVVRPSAI